MRSIIRSIILLAGLLTILCAVPGCFFSSEKDREVIHDNNPPANHP
jgi:hypothetical protein